MPSYTVSILRHDDSAELYTFEQTTVIVGREAGDLVTGDPQMSNRHAELTFSGGQLTATDLNSTNGTYLRSGERLAAPQPLTPGTALRLGGCTLTVQEIVTGFERGGTQVMNEVPAAISPASPAPASPAPTAPAPAPVVSAAPQGYPLGAGMAGSGAGASSASSGDRVKDFGNEIELMAAAGPASEALFDQFKYYAATGLQLYKQHYMNGIMTTGLVMVPAALLSALFGLIPVVGIFLGFLVMLGQLALAPISTGAMGRWALAAASGRSLTWQQVWGAALKNPVQEWLNMAVMTFVTLVGFLVLIIPGIVLGMFSIPSYLLEDKRFIGSNLRSAELVMKDPGRLIGLAALMVLTALPIMLAAAIVGIILAFVPMIGGPLGQVISVAAAMLVVPFIYLLWSLVYFDTRKRLEQTDARAEYQAKFDEWS